MCHEVPTRTPKSESRLFLSHGHIPIMVTTEAPQSDMYKWRVQSEYGESSGDSPALFLPKCILELC